MAQLTSDELAKSVIAAHGAIHLLVIDLLGKELISDKTAHDAISLMYSSNHVTKNNMEEAKKKLEQLISM